MTRLARLFAVAGFAFLASISAPAGATSLAPLTVDQMVDASDLVVIGKVLSVEAEATPGGRVYTYVEIEIERGLKGLAEAGDYLRLEAPGGVTAAGEFTDVSLAPRFSEGERALLFLAEKRFGTLYGTVGMSLGKYTIKQDPATGHDMVVRFTVPYTQAFDARFVPNPPANDRVSLDAMLSAVEARVELGWDGAPIPGIAADKLRAINKLQAGVK
ncbi:MAG: hypothetical protein FJ090_15810 [Deltaproteobacteria bacterium]|nr:hypothetical protein [Deltaproteobacteria bacterium]